MFKFVLLIGQVSLFSIIAIGGFAGIANARDYYAAIATGTGSIWGDSWNFPTRAQAEAAALQKCGDSSCVVRVWVRNGCAAVAKDGIHNSVAWAWAYSRSEAEAQAIATCADGACRIEVSDCTSGAYR